MMKLTINQEYKITSILNIFETGKKELEYNGVYVYPDGPRQQRQVTLSIGFTESSGSLLSVLKIYIESKGKYAEYFIPYLSKIGTYTLYKNNAFKELLKQAADDIIFREAQDYVYRVLYILPAREMAYKLGLTLPLSILVVQDSILHGSFQRVRNLFPEVPPISGGDEKKFITAYCKARKTWWLNHVNNPYKNIEGKGSYRMDLFLDLINKNDWALESNIITNGVTI